MDFNPVILPRKTFHIHCSKQGLYKCRRKSFTRCYYLSYKSVFDFCLFSLDLVGFSHIHLAQTNKCETFESKFLSR